jgi:hypothetical protein
MTKAHEITREEAALAGRMADAIVKVRDEFSAAGDGWKADRVAALLDLPTHSILTLAKAFGSLSRTA